MSYWKILDEQQSEGKGTGKALSSAVSFTSLCNTSQILHGSSNMETSVSGLYLANRLKCSTDDCSIFKALISRLMNKIARSESPETLSSLIKHPEQCPSLQKPSVHMVLLEVLLCVPFLVTEQRRFGSRSDIQYSIDIFNSSSRYVTESFPFPI